MIKLISIFALFVAAACMVNGQVREIKNQSVERDSVANKQTLENARTEDKSNIEDILGSDLVTFITKARRINIYRLREFAMDSTRQQRWARKKYFVDYEVLGSGKLNKKKSKDIKKALLDAKNYIELDFLNKCTFTATVGWEIKTRNRSVNVLLSYPCKKVLFLENGQEFYYDVNSVKLFDQVAQTFFRNLPLVE